MAAAVVWISRRAAVAAAAVAADTVVAVAVVTAAAATAMAAGVDTAAAAVAAGGGAVVYGGGGGGGSYGGGGPRGGGGGGGFQDREPKERGPRQNGTLKFFNNGRGFGFITPESGGKDVFVHISAIERSGLQQLAEGTKLSFETEDDRRGRGPQAVSLQLDRRIAGAQPDTSRAGQRPRPFHIGGRISCAARSL